MPRNMAVGILVFVCSSSVFADIYTWKDTQGVVHFTDAPPPDQNYKPVEVATPVIVPMASNLSQKRRASKIQKRVQAAQSSDYKRGSVGKDSETKARAKARARQKKNCANYRRKLANIQSQLRAGYSNSKGNSLRRKRRKLNQSLNWECILR